MALALVTGSAGLIGSESVKFLIEKGFDVIGIDNNLREYFFGKDASTLWNREFLIKTYKNYSHFNIDVRNESEIEKLFHKFKFDLIIHAAAQPSHDWAAREPITDFTVNANGTLILLENFRKYAPEAVFIFTSTNKVYGDTPNQLPLVELEKRYEIPNDNKFYNGIDETMNIDASLHSIFGASKVAADILVQEYGKYFGLKTVCFRGGCLSGPAHSGAEMHGFLSYLMRCCIQGKKYFIYGYKGKQVRDNIHSHDLVNMFWHFYKNPKKGEVYNAGGSRFSNCSILEAIEICEKLSGKKLDYEYTAQNRIGDHIWYISDISKFKSHYSNWNFEYSLEKIMEEIFEYQNYLFKKGIV